jgi:hypothetical protein
LDYLSIGAASVCLLGAMPPGPPALPRPPPLLSALTVAAHPLAATVLHGLGAEVSFAATARALPALQPAHRLHMGLLAVAGGLFLAEEVWPRAPLLHAAWHTAAALTVASYDWAM